MKTCCVHSRNSKMRTIPETLKIIYHKTNPVFLKTAYCHHPNICVPTFFYPHPKTCLLILERGREREKHRCERETPTGCLSHVPRLNLQPRHLPRAGIKPVTFQFMGWDDALTNWATTIRASVSTFKYILSSDTCLEFLLTTTPLTLFLFKKSLMEPSLWSPKCKIKRASQQL